MSNVDHCDIFCYNEDKVNRMKEQLEPINFSTVIPIIKLLADENRFQLLYALSKEEELCVCDLALIIGASIATTSHHLRSLYKLGVVAYRKEGKLAFYRLSDQRFHELLRLALSFSNKKEVTALG